MSFLSTVTQSYSNVDNQMPPICAKKEPGNYVVLVETFSFGNDNRPSMVKLYTKIKFETDISSYC